jgi:coenzyme F420-dependent glucose-6-phosphate dehydrogenase
MGASATVSYGYKASAEQFPPRELLDFSVAAEQFGFDAVAVSDHFQAWRHHGGHAPMALVWLGALGERTERVRLTTSVLTPTLRYQPPIIAQAFATLACLNPGRVVLGVGSGEAMNETPATGAAWPAFRERSERLAEAVELTRLLWTEERVTFEGRYYRTDRATIYDRPQEVVPIYIAAGGPKAAVLAGRAGDGFICTSGKGANLYHDFLAHLEEGARAAGRDPAALSGEEKAGIEDPLELERLADAAADRAHTRFIVSDDPDEVVEQVGFYVELGLTELVFHFPGEDQRRALSQFAAHVLPRMRSRWA